MIFSSPLFLFVFLPVVLAGYYAMPPRVKNAFLLLASLVFYAWGEPIYVALLVASIVGNYAFGLAIDRTHSTVGRRLVVTLAVLGNLAFLAYFKYFSFALVNFFSADSAQALASAAPDHLPLGISFFTFQALSYIIDVYRRTSPAQANPFSLALFISSFPQMIAGPIIRYADVQRQIEFRVHEAHLFVSGVRRFVFGLAKKVLIADVLGDSADQIFAEDAEDLSAGAIWLGIVCFAFQIYFDFSAYSDMAIGLGRMFGFRFKENFNYPYISRSLTEMWERWHISLGSWFRDYLYIPLGGNRHGAFRTHLNLWTVFLLCGLWHGASWNFVIWGALHGSVLVIERLGLGRLLQRTWAPLQHAYFILIFLFTLIFFRVAELPDAMHLVSLMTGLAEPGYLSWQQFYDRGMAITLALALVLSAPVYPAFSRWLVPLLGPHSLRHQFSQLMLLVGIYAITVMGIASSAYSPFIYFRF